MSAFSIGPVANSNCMNKIVRWLHDDTVSLRRKVGAIALATIAALAAGYVVGHTAIVFTAVALSAGIGANIELGKIKKADAEATRIERLGSSFAQMQKVFGGPEAWEALPVVAIGGEIDRPIMRGRTGNGKPFVAMKWLRQDNGAEAPVIIWQPLAGTGTWTLRFHNEEFFNRVNPFKANLDQEDWAILSQIVNGKHPLFAIAK